jgi:CRP-like cAMP-binding protein
MFQLRQVSLSRQDQLPGTSRCVDEGKNVKDEADELRLGFLATAGWLAEESADTRARMGALGRWMTVRRGEPLYEAGDEPMAIYGLAKGLLDLSVPLPQGEEVLIHRAPPGFWIGDGMILTGHRRAMTVRAVAPSRVLAISVGALRNHLARVPEDWVALHRLAARNAALAVTALAEILSLPPRQRFACVILRTMASDGTVQATQGELGQLAGMSRAAFRRAFGELIAQGVVRTEYGAIRVLDRARLTTIAHAPRA